jgi:hypothetical protein
MELESMAEPFTYVPVLRWKAAEQNAFARLSPAIRREICPLIEICPPGFPTGSSDEVRTCGRLRTTALSIVDTCRGHQVFVDLKHLEKYRPNLRCSGGIQPLEYLFKCIENERLLFPDQLPICIPVTGVQRSRAYQQASISIARSVHRLCVRLSRQEIQEKKLADSLFSLLDGAKLHAQEVDVIVDFGILPRSKTPLRFLETNLPLINQWRTLTFIAGTFPLDLQGFKPVGRHTHPREEWHYFVEHILQDSAFSERALYGDYTVQHPEYREPPSNCNPSASIRYSTSDSVIVMKGESLKKKDGPGSRQWPAQARVLSSFTNEFFGPKHCSGCDYIASMASGGGGTGDCTTWLTAAINHSMSLAVQQVTERFALRTSKPTSRSKG